MQTFTAPLATTYKIECWGAQGGNMNFDDVVVGGVKGGYTSGILNLLKQSTLYIYVGQHPDTQDYIGCIETIRSFSKGYNGGGAGAYHCQAGNSGGGATDLRLVSGNWNDFNSLKSRIMVAAGGTGTGHMPYPNADAKAGAGGGLTGFEGQDYRGPNVETRYRGTGGTQTYAGNCQEELESINGVSVKDSKLYQGGFGFGGDAYSEFKMGGVGGGGGYYGGGASCRGHVCGGGGSSFISGYTGCDAISSESTENNIIHTGQPNHYSGKVFTNPVMIDGASTMPSPSGETETGHSGHGYCIITWFPLSLEP
ncbi:glycine rich domain-containing protein [Segatella albensis]|uniref:glycine rich domain-containing protein n=2 Tax=Segatella albensis TaxID=77768 RepID=UPI000687B10A|nr:glycine rich domain-containing protein [Segatella albensis]